MMHVLTAFAGLTGQPPAGRQVCITYEHDTDTVVNFVTHDTHLLYYHLDDLHNKDGIGIKHFSLLLFIVINSYCILCEEL